MNNAEIIQHQGKDVIIMDLANITPVDVIKRIKVVEEKIVEFPMSSLYLLILTANLAYNSITSANLNDFAQLYGKYLKSSVVVDETRDSTTSPSNEDGPKKSKVFSNTSEALDWLVTQ